MDNEAASANTSAELFKIYNNIDSIYNPFKFGIQQVITNDLDLQSMIDQNSGSVTPVNCKLLVLNWDRIVIGFLHCHVEIFVWTSLPAQRD